jgi:hypothetical protein
MKMIDGCESCVSGVVCWARGLRPWGIRLEPRPKCRECASDGYIGSGEPAGVELQLQSSLGLAWWEERPWIVNRRRVLDWYEMRRCSSSAAMAAEASSSSCVEPPRPRNARNPEPCEWDRRERWVTGLVRLGFCLVATVSVDGRVASSSAVLLRRWNHLSGMSVVVVETCGRVGRLGNEARRRAREARASLRPQSSEHKSYSSPRGSEPSR